MSWDTVSGADGYNVYKGDHTKIGTTTSSNYHMSGLTPGITYTYIVTAYNDSTESADSEPFSITLDTHGQISSLTAPLNLQASDITTNSFTLSWDPVQGATGYHVYTGEHDIISTTTDPNCTMSGLTPGGTYTYIVTAYNNTTESADSQPFSITLDTDG